MRRIRDIPVSVVLDKMILLFTLAVVAWFIRASEARHPPAGPDIPRVSSSIGMDELWKDAVNNKASSLKFAPSIPGPPPARRVVEPPRVLKRPAPPPEPELEPLAPVAPAPPEKPAAPKLKPVSYSFATQAASSAKTSAFYAPPKVTPAVPAAAPENPQTTQAPPAAQPASNTPNSRFRHLYSH